MNKTIKFLSVYSVLAIAMVTGGAFSATTTGAARPSIASTASRVKVAGGASTMRTPTATVPKTTTTPTPTAPETEAMPDPEPEPERVIVVDNKTSQFDDVLSDIAGIAPDSSASDLAERVRQQRALLDGASNSTLETSGIKMGANACDSGLRKCMAEKCGNDFTKCANDSTAIWGDKMDSCRRTTNCTGHEYSLLAPEILADRDMNVRMSYYNSVLNCGNRYNSCIFNECGKYMDKCLAKSDGDRAVAKCESIARECREQDSGLASRVMSAFGGLRTIATEQVKKDEARLYELRDLMRTQCNRLGAMFDERTLDCVYTVNFFAGDDTETPKASKKLYAGDTFQCNANWFGVDVTTFKENAYRLTRSQTSASAAMLGAGVGTAAGLVSSGAINRAIDTQNAKKAADAAAKQDECVKAGGTWKNGTCEGTSNASSTSVNNINDDTDLISPVDINNKTECGDAKCDECQSWCKQIYSIKQKQLVYTDILKPNDNCNAITSCEDYANNLCRQEYPVNSSYCVDYKINDVFADTQDDDNQHYLQCYVSAEKQPSKTTICGKIIDETGELVSFATGKCGNTSIYSPNGVEPEAVAFPTNMPCNELGKGYYSDFDGKFCIDINNTLSDNTKCEFSFVGYQNKITTIGEIKNTKTVKMISIAQAEINAQNKPDKNTKKTELKTNSINDTTPEQLTLISTTKNVNCDRLCTERVKQLTPKKPLVVLYNKNNEKQCVKTCEPLMRDACTKHKTDKNTVKFRSYQVTNDWWFECKIQPNKEPPSQIMNINCASVCNNLNLNPENLIHNAQVFSSPECMDACKPTIQSACQKLTDYQTTYGSNRVTITNANAKYDERNGEMYYYCSFSYKEN